MTSRLEQRRAARRRARPAGRPPAPTSPATHGSARPNPLLDHDGAPTLNLTASGNPSPAQFLKAKFATLRRLIRTGVLDSPAGRREATRYDPFLFALVYMPHYLVLNPEDPANAAHPYGGITLCQFHVDSYISIEEWAIPSTITRADRDGWVAPRESAKSTMFFTIGPLWAAAHGHQRFIAAFSDSEDQVQKHLAKFHENIDNNKTLQEDFPDLCTPARRSNGNAVNDNKNEYVSKSGFTFSAHTIDGKIVGLVSHENLRPTLLILDDVEPSEDKYSMAMKAKGINRLRDKILYLNEKARVVLVGTVTMAGSIMHDIVQSVLNPGAPAPIGPGNPYGFGSLVPGWIKEQNFRGHYYPALSVSPATGELQSLWPEKWPVAELAPRLGTNDFMKNMQNNPVGSGDYWESGDIIYGQLAGTTVTALSIDPAVTVSDTSDYTGLAVVRYQPANPTKITADMAARAPRVPPPPPAQTLDELALRRARRRGRVLPPGATDAQRAAYTADIKAQIDPQVFAGTGHYQPANRSATAPAATPEGLLLPAGHARCEIAWATRVKMRPARLYTYVVSILERFPEISIIIIETNQGHEYVSEPFQDLPVRIITKTQSEHKDVRIARTAGYYKSLDPQVVHAEHFVPLEEEMYAYPQTANDDTIDAASTGIQYFLFKDPKKARKHRPPPRAAATSTYVTKAPQRRRRRAAA